MSSHPQLPKIGDRVRIGEHGGVYIVVEVNDETQSVSVLREPEIVHAPVDKLIPVVGPNLQTRLKLIEMPRN